MNQLPDYYREEEEAKARWEQQQIQRGFALVRWPIYFFPSISDPLSILGFGPAVDFDGSDITF